MSNRSFLNYHPVYIELLENKKIIKYHFSTKQCYKQEARDTYIQDLIIDLFL